MDAEFVQDWEKTKQRYAAWWHNEVADRPLVLIRSQRETPRWPLKTLPDVTDHSRRHFDIEYRIDQVENTLAETDFFGDAVLHVARGVNTGYLGSFCGAPLEFTERTVWIDPYVEDWTTAPTPTFDTTTDLFRHIEAVSRALHENARGRYLLAIPDHLDAVTSMSQMRGVEALMFDMMENPGPVHAYRDAMTAVWTQSLDWWAAHDRAMGADGFTNWARAWSPARGGVLQSDFSAMISPKMLAEFVLPEMRAEAAHLDGAIYHLDGPGQIPHVDLLCDVPGLDVIQWIWGAGNPEPVDWPDLLTHIQSKGKALQVYCRPEHLDRLFEFLRPEGVMFILDQIYPPDVCRDVIKRIAAWAGGKNGA